MKPLFGAYERVHLVGVGGAGMEGLARILRQKGCRVSGSDRVESRALESLRQEGFPVFVGHRAEQVEGAELVIYSAAVPEHNEELRAARAAKIALAGRAEVLGELTRARLAAAVAGSHGKTTTASMLAAVLRRAGLEPGVLIGGWAGGGPQAGWGRGELFVVEADEFARSFLRLYPSWAVVTSVDAEHLDTYGDLGEVEAAFGHFLARLPFYGAALVAGDGKVGEAAVAKVQRPCLRYGMGADNDYRAAHLERGAWGSRFTAEYRGELLGEVELQVPGEHNVRNALGAAGLAHVLGVDFEIVAAALGDFAGVARRLERRGEAGGVLVVDDYAHHPAEISAGLEVARGTGRRVVALFQPHLYSRTRDLAADFARALAPADRVVLAAVYGSREQPLPGVDSELIAGALRAAGHGAVEYVPERGILLTRLLDICQSGDLLLVMGAGDIDEVAAALLAALRERD